MKTFLALVTLLCAAAITQAQWTSEANQPPAFHATPPAQGQTLPPVLTEKQLAEQGFNQPAQIASYKAAAKVGSVMYQVPCYCYCDRSFGHTSLHSCFESAHGAHCGTCMAETLYAYQMTKKGLSTKTIRDGIIRGDWKLVDLQHPDPVN